MSTSDPALIAARPCADAPRHRSHWTQLWFWVVLGLVGGAVVGLVAPETGAQMKFLPDIFIQLVKTVTAPVIFCTVIVGIASIGSLAAAGGIATRALGYFLLMTVIALGLGLAAVNTIRPGAGFPTIPPDPAALADAQADLAEGSHGGGVIDFVRNVLLPESFFGPFVDSFNLDGSCIYLTMAALFIAQAGGQDLPWEVQLALLGLMLLTSKGQAGVSGAGLITLAASLQVFGGEFYTPQAIAIGIAIIAGIDRIMSEGRSLTNVVGNTVATMVVAGWCGQRDDERFHAALDDPSLVRDAIEREAHIEPNSTTADIAAPENPGAAAPVR